LISPLVYITLFYILGIILQNQFDLPLFLLITLTFSAFIASIAFLFNKKFFYIALAFVIVFCGMSYFSLRNNDIKHRDYEFFPQIREKFVSVPQKLLPKPYSQLLGSMIFGSKVALPPEEAKEAFRKTGTIHLLVASGLHLSILMGSLINLFRFLSLPNKIGSAFALILGFLYVLMVGAGASIVRAFIMAGMSLFANLLERENDSLSALSFAALILLIITPHNIFKIGFQLSFAATFALLYAAPIFEKTFSEKIPKIIRVALSVSLAPYIFTMPIIFYNFSQISVVAVLVNALIISWVGYVIILGFCAIILGSIFLSVAYIFSGVLFFLLFALNSLVFLFSSIPFASFNIGAPNLVIIFMYYSGVFAIISMMNKKQAYKFNKSHLLVIVLAIASIFVWQASTDEFQFLVEKELNITVIDVGQGDSIFISTPSDKKILIDGGNGYAGRCVVLPFLRKSGVNKLDVVILTHPHSDHVGGFKEILSQIKVDLVLDSGQAHTSNYYMNFLKLIEKNKIKYKVARAGDTLDFYDGVTADILGPFDPLLVGTNSDLNNNSIVLKLGYDKFSMLFTGDLEEAGEKRLITNGANLNSDVLKVGHHGSKTSCSKEFLDRVRPEAAVISVGAKNKFGHSSMSVIDNLKFIGAKVFRTDNDGSIIIKTNGKHFMAEPCL